MASTFNAFEALKASGELSANPSKKKNKNKSKAKAKPEAEQGEKQVAGQAVAVPAPEAAVPVLDEAQILERAAKHAESGATRAKLWKEWISQAQDAHKGPNFKQTLLGTRAVELTLENCLNAPLTPQQDALLTQMLSLVLPFGDGYVTQRLHSAVQQLSTVDLDAAPDVKTLVTHSLNQLVAWLKTQGPSNGKAPSDVETWVARMADIDRSILQKQASLKSIGPTVGKEHISCAWQMLKLQEEKVDLLKPGAIPSGTAMKGAPRVLVSSLQSLREAIGSYLQHDTYTNSSGGAYDYQRQQALSVYKSEESVLAQKAAQLNAQIKQLENQLRALRSELGDVEDKRTALQKLQSSGGGTAKSAPATQQGLPLAPAHAALALEAAETLNSLVEQTGDSRVEQQLALAQQSQGSAPVEYTGLARHYLAMSSTLLGELPQKVEFCRQRIERAEKMIALSSSSSKILETNKKQKEESEKVLADTVKWAEDTVKDTKEVLKNVTERYGVLRQVSPEQSDLLGQELRDIEELCARIQLQYHQVTRAVHAELTAPAAPAAAAPHNRVPGPQAPAPAPAPVPIPAAAAATHALGNLSLGPTIPTMGHVGLPAELARAPMADPIRPPVGNAVVAPPARPVAPVARPTAPAAAPHANGAAPRPAAPPRTWGKVAPPPASTDPADDSLPTPAEAFKEPTPAEAAGSSQSNRRRRA